MGTKQARCLTVPYDLNQKYLQQLAAFECQDATFLFKNPSLILDRAEGSYIWDVEGNRYVDLCAGFGSLPLGHAHASLLKVFSTCQKRSNRSFPIMMGLGDVYPSRSKIEFLRLLKSFLPDHLKKGTLALSGSHAVEIALKTAQLATRKAGFICFDGSYHGLDLGVLPITSRSEFKAPFKKWLREENVVSLPLNCRINLIENTIIKQKKQGIGTAGLVVEPIQGRAGIIPAEISWLQDLRILTKEHNISLIFDEVLTGAGRSGKFTFADEIPCDLLCLGKAIGGGFPLSACFGTEKIMRAWPKSTGESIHTGTFFGHPFCCAVGIETLLAIKNEKLVSRSKKLGQELLSILCSTFLQMPLVSAVRGTGLMLSIEFSKPGYGVTMMNRLRKENIIALVSGNNGQCLSLTPAFNINKKDLFNFVEVFKRLIKNK